MPNHIEIAPSGRASCRGCKQPIAKGVPRFAEEAPNPYSEEGGTSYRYWHLACAAPKLANELAAALPAYDGPVDDRPALDAVIAQNLRPELPYAERASSGRAKCRACDEALKKGDLRVAFERVFEGPMGPQKGAAYAHPRCVGPYLAREKEQGRQASDLDEAVRLVVAHSKLPAAELEGVAAEMRAG
jgi:hypothetical protein